MSRQKTTLLIGCLFLILCSACRSPKKADRFTDTATTGTIPVSADESFRPILQQEIDVFHALYPEARILPIYTDEVEAINLLLSDSVRMAITTRGLTPQEETTLNQKKLFPHQVKIATDGVALIVNKQNPDSLISVAQLQQILTGKITRWDQLHKGSTLGPIQFVFDNKNSSTVRYAIDSICRGEPLSENLFAQGNNAEVINYVARVPQAIGVIGASWIGNKEDSTNLSFSDRVCVLAVSREKIPTPETSFKPFQAYLALGRYPLAREVYIILTDPRNGLSSGLTSFICTDKGQRIILKTGIVPATQAIRIVNVRENL